MQNSVTDNSGQIVNSEINNFILSRMPQSEYKELSANLQRVEMKQNDVVNHQYEYAEYVYFPESCLVSSVKIFEDGTSIETGSIGKEGVTGISVALSKRPSQRESFVQISGEAFRIESDKFRAALKRDLVFSRLVQEFIFSYLMETSLNVACNAHHNVNQRLAKWLLICQYKTNRSELDLTQDFIAQMLGIHRPGVTLAAITLKDEGLIHYQRGMIAIVDKEGLEEVTCECYKTLKTDYQSTLTI